MERGGRHLRRDHRPAHGFVLPPSRTDSQWRDRQPGGKRILNVGCGHGWLGARYARHGAKVVGMDGSKALIDEARATDRNAAWIVHDLDHGLPPDLGPFDVAIAHMVLMDLPVLAP